MIKRVSRDKAYGALLFIDLDHFKLINDTKGHDIGDIVLVETAKRIKNCIRQIDIASRLGGDEFVVALEIEENDEDKVIDSMTIVANKILEEIKKPYLIHNFDFRLTASIGIMLFKDSNHKLDELMKFADTAMYNAKEKGRNRYSYFDPKLQALLEQKADLAKHLREAIDKKMMFLNYQLQIISHNKEDKVVGVEALVRWNDPKKGIIGPNLFIPIAEETGLIIPLGNWILKEVMIQLKQWEEDEIKKDWRISVNVSYRQFEQDNFVHKLKSLIEKYKINPSKLRLEITENLLIKDTQNIINKISELSLIGVTISIDDFGTGYSSLAYLKQLSIDELKIDQSFIKDILTDSNDLVIVETMLSIGKKFNLEIIAEGVETKEQYEKLVSMGCSYFQGYFFGKPVDTNLL